MKAMFRVDASVDIGTGHVMRCLTLADALAQQGAECQFICRSHTGNAIDYIRQKGFSVHVLSTAQADDADVDNELVHARWLGATQQQDAQESSAILSGIKPDWLVVDHYALDQRWQHPLREHCSRIMAIDDLADRVHDCDLLLDQNLGSNAEYYCGRVPPHAQVLNGPDYALLRFEFAQLREASLKRRAYPRLERILVSMGGIDKPNATGQVLAALQACMLPANCKIDVVMGAAAPSLELVRQLAEQMRVQTTVLTDVSDMAQRMVHSDLAIGAAGSTSWERCCLGLPTLLVVIAENQKQVAGHLQQVSAVVSLTLGDGLGAQLQRIFKGLDEDRSTLVNMSKNAAQITDGKGCQRVVCQMQDTLQECK